MADIVGFVRRHLGYCLTGVTAEQFLTWLDPPPAAHELPERLNSPFDVGEPHPLVTRALEVVMAPLRRCNVAGANPAPS